ncbi:MAG TPA: hypothetical protein VIM12_00475 [Noviherbaspirillum sp.]|jgi:hypothetical protein|uniref:hypothetical protein n=1 Tax=Noviherbaspirillum sp. TaxID=1926288 RepID=UPI002F956F9D
MNYPKNEFGVPQYPDNDARRLFVLLSAIDLLERPTASAVADLTGMDRDSIDADIARLREEFGVMLHKVGETYHIDSWGAVLRQSGVKSYLKPA